MVSQIPLYGLVHNIDIVRFIEGSDGAGGVVLTEDYTLVYSNVECRISNLNTEDELKGFGESSGTKFTILSPPLVNTEKSDFVRLSSRSIDAPILRKRVYRIIDIKNAIDHTGEFHHTSITIDYAQPDR